MQVLYNCFKGTIHYRFNHLESTTYFKLYVLYFLVKEMLCGKFFALTRRVPSKIKLYRSET